MNSSYYDSKIEEAQKKINAAANCLTVAIDYATYAKNPKISEIRKRRVYDLAHKMKTSSEEIQKKYKILHQIRKIIRKIDKKKLPPRHDEEKIKSILEKYKTNGFNYSEISRAASTIDDDPLFAIINYAQEYLNAVEQKKDYEKSKLDEENRRKEEEKRREEERRRREEEERKREEEREAQRLERTNTESYPYPSSYPYSSYEPVSNQGSNVKYIGFEEIQKIVEELTDSNSKHFISNVEIESIIAACKRKDNVDKYSGRYYSEDNIKSLIKFYRLSSRERKLERNAATSNFEYEKITEMGEMTVDLIFNEIMNKKDYKNVSMDGFISKFLPKDVLARYEGARKRWLKYYNGLNEKNKAAVDRVAEENDQYRKMFNILGTTGADIVDSNTIISMVNQRVRKYYSDHYIFSNMDDYTNEFPLQFKEQFEKSVKYMSAEEIADLYRSIMYDEYTRYASDVKHTPEEAKKIQKIKNIRHANLQQLVVETIAKRISNKKDLNMSDDERSKQRETLLVAICKDYLHEEPKFELQFAKEINVEEGYGNRKIKKAEVIEEANKRLGEMNKIQRKFNAIKRGRIDKLNQQDTLTDEEIKEVEGMFRR